MSDIEEMFKPLNGGNDEKQKLNVKAILSIIKEYWGILWNKKRIIVAAGVIGAIIGYIYAYNRKTTYTANYTFTIGGSSSSASGIGGLSSLLNIGGSSMDAFSGDNVLELIKSHSLVESTLLSATTYNEDSITFIEYALICDSVRAKCKERDDEEEEEKNVISICDIEFPLGQKRETFSRAQDSILIAYAQKLIDFNIQTSRRDKKLSFMDFSFQFKNEEFAKRFSEAHLEETSQYYIQTKTCLAQKNIETFQIKADSVKNKLDQCFVRRASYADSNRNSNGQIASVAQWKIDTEIQILSSTYTEMLKNLELLKMNLAKETPLIQIIDRPRYPLANDKMRKLKGFINGGFICGFLTCCVIIGINILSKIEKEEEEE